jgi:uncharacterized protein
MHAATSKVLALTLSPDRPSATWGPTPARERVHVVDVLRGVALFGVFLVNLCGFCGAGIMATQTQLNLLPTHHLDEIVEQIIAVFFEDKANTLFAFLFGLGFFLQLQRAQARGADFVAVYKRRLTVLLFLGMFHILLLWTWEILHLYAMLGFALLAMRRVSNRTLLVAGVALTLFDWRIPQEALIYFNQMEWHGFPSLFSDEAVLERQALSEAGDYFGLVATMAKFTFVDYILTGALFAWLLYAFGRFLLGAWVGRNGWLFDTKRYANGFKIVMWICLPLGFALTYLHRWLFEALDTGRLTLSYAMTTLTAVHTLAVPTLAAGYACAIVVATNTSLGSKLLSPFAYAGRMALSNYVAQSFVIGFVLFGVGPGLALAGKIGVATAASIVVGTYALQVIISRWWLARFRFGPLEWLWRGLTYREWPPMRVPAPADRLPSR